MLPTIISILTSGLSVLVVIYVFRKLSRNVNELEYFQEALYEKQRVEIVPRIYTYLDEEIINSLYNQIQGEIMPREISTEGIDEEAAGIGIRYPIDSKIEKSKSHKIQKRYVIQPNLESKYNLFKSHIYETRQFTYGLEELYEYSSWDVNALEEQLYDEALLASVKEVMERKAAIEKLSELRTMKGIVYVKGNFHISEIGEEKLSAVLSHQINRILVGEPEIKIELQILKKYITHPGLDSFLLDSNSYIAAMGTVVRWVEDERTLKIRSIALY